MKKLHHITRRAYSLGTLKRAIAKPKRKARRKTKKKYSTMRPEKWVASQPAHKPAPAKRREFVLQTLGAKKTIDVPTDARVEYVHDVMKYDRRSSHERHLERTIPLNAVAEQDAHNRFYNHYLVDKLGRVHSRKTGRIVSHVHARKLRRGFSARARVRVVMEVTGLSIKDVRKLRTDNPDGYEALLIKSADDE